MLTLAILLLVALAYGALALIFVPMIRTRDFDKKHIPRKNWILAGIFLAAAISLGLLGLPALSP